jgi:hypothetical protein
MPLGGAFAISGCHALFMNTLKSRLSQHFPKHTVTSILHGNFPHTGNETSLAYSDEVVQSYAVAVRHTFIVPFVAFLLFFLACFVLLSSKPSKPPENYEMYGTEEQNDFERQREESRVYTLDERQVLVER